MEFSIEIRKAEESDLSEILQLFVSTVERINIKDYSSHQIKAWKSSVNNLDRWKSKIRNQHFLIALQENSMVGFSSFEYPDYLDLLYVHANHQRKGIAQQLYSAIEQYAKESKSNVIHSEVSITALDFFKKQGFKIIEQQEVLVNTTLLTNYKMVKTI